MKDIRMDSSGKKLALLGASGHGKVVADTALASDWREVVFFDDAWPNLAHLGHWSVDGDSVALMKRIDEFDGVIVAIGNCTVRMRKHEELVAAGASIPVLVHPRAWISPYAYIAPGTVVMAGAVINADAKVGTANIINTGATVDHDCDLADGVHIAPGAHLSGNVSVGACSWIGVGAAVKQGVRIGAGAMVGAGAVVIDAVADNTTVIGNPAAPLKRG